jgi:hypothetical protein
MTSYIQGKFNDININFFGCDIIKGHCDLINFQTLVLSHQAWLVNRRAYYSSYSPIVGTHD